MSCDCISHFPRSVSCKCKKLAMNTYWTLGGVPVSCFACEQILSCYKMMTRPCSLEGTVVYDYWTTKCGCVFKTFIRFIDKGLAVPILKTHTHRAWNFLRSAGGLILRATEAFYFAANPYDVPYCIFTCKRACMCTERSESMTAHLHTYTHRYAPRVQR